MVCCPPRDVPKPRLVRVEADVKEVLFVMESEDLGNGLSNAEITDSLKWEKGRVRRTLVALLSSRQISSVGTKYRITNHNSVE